MNPDSYLDHIGLPALDPSTVTPDHETLGRLLTAQVTSVPFENLAIVGDPYGAWEGDGVSLELPALFEKIVQNDRGGFCFELNGLFTWVLRALGYDVDRCAARIGGDEDSLGRPPANHHTVVVHLDRRYLADVGTAPPQLRTPVPLDGTVVEDAAGVRWRVDPADMPLSEYALWVREPGADRWDRSYRFQTDPRELSYFAATCEFLANEPDGTFTSGPMVKRSTADGYLALDRESLVRTAGTTRTEDPVSAADWHDVLAQEFGIRL